MKRLHENSSESHDIRKNSGDNEDYRFLIFCALRDSDCPMTDREVMLTIGEAEKNNVSPEITRLKEDGLISECDRKQRCSVTGRTVRAVVSATDVYVPRSRGSRRPQIGKVCARIPPSEPGFYWYGEVEPMRVVQVARVLGRLYVTRNSVPVDDLSGYWSRKLEPPNYP
jgi:hypothetical protein